MLDHEKAVQHSERRRRHGKQVQADDGFAVIAKKTSTTPPACSTVQKPTCPEFNGLRA
jgi:hypothetical protein